MKTTLIVLFFCLAPLFLIYGIRYSFIEWKRTLRKGELRHHIMMINDPKGLPNYYHLNEAIHISEHYGIPLSEAGYKGDYSDLAADAGKSIDRYERRLKHVESTAQNIWAKGT